MKLTPAEEAMREGAAGPAAQWAIGQQIEVGRFFGAERLVSVGSVLAGAEIGITGMAGLELVERLAREGARVAVPSYTAACSLDFNRWRKYGLPEAQFEAEQRLHRALVEMGFLDTSTCIGYQTVGPPRFGEHVGWGDTGAVAFANAACGARSNYEGGPAAIAAAITGRVPEYGFHLPAARRATRLFEVATPLEGTSDWSALGAWIGARMASYWEVPAVVIDGPPPSIDALKHCLAAAASLGSIAMMHLVGITPEAPDVAAAFGDRNVPAAERIDRAALGDVYRRYAAAADRIDLVVFSAPQLSLAEAADVVARLAGRRVADGTRLVLTVNPAVEGELARLGLLATLEAAGGELISGTCFYVMAPRLVRERFGFRNVVTPSTKLTNILGGAGYETILAPVEACIEAAVTGRLPS